MTQVSRTMPSAFRFKLASRYVDAGGIIAYPTEAVWGLGCDPFDEQAVLRLLAIKQRPMKKGLILVAATMTQLEPYLQLPNEDQRKQLAQSWPGPNTWLVPHNGRIPDWISGGRSSVAVRVSAHPLVSALCRELDMPLVSTSANPGGLPPAKSVMKVRQYFGDTIDYIVGGPLGGLKSPTPIRDLLSGEQVRG